MKYIAVFDVPEGWTPDEWIPGAQATFKDQHEYYKVFRARLKAFPERIPKEWHSKAAEGFNACLDALESS